MGLFQKAVETYDYMADSFAGKEIEGKETLAPIGFMLSKADIVITLKQNGEFVKAEPFDKGKKIIVPVTENSSGRTSSASKVPHPLFDRLLYMCPDNIESYNAYISQLKKWCESSFSVPQIKAVLAYVKKGTIREDLKKEKVPIKSGKDIDKDFIVWRILTGNETEAEDLWCNSSLIESYVNYCQNFVSGLSKKSLCYISGDILPAASQHLKGVVAACGNAKLISANDSTNFTYRGRFCDDIEALGVSYIASQKAHNALKWIAANDGDRFGDRTIISWNPRGKIIHNPRKSLFIRKNDVKIVPSDYRDSLRKIVLGYRSDINFNDETITAIFEAATSGRLSVSYYSEMKSQDFLERLRIWDESSAWLHPIFGVTSPGLDKIVDAAFGTLRANDNNQYVETDGKVISSQMQRLFVSKLEGKSFPTDIMRSAVEKCEFLQLYEGNNRTNQLFVTCSIIRKFKYDHYKEDWPMALEPEKKNRSYQYGRLLAVMEKIERDTYDKDEKRETNAIRIQELFVKRPAYAQMQIMERLKSAYYPKLSVGRRVFYEKLVGQIMSQLSFFSELEINKPLSEEYLMGYYLQKNDLYQSITDIGNNEAEVE